MKRLQIPQKLVNEKFRVHETTAVILPEKRKEKCKPNNRHLNRD